MNKAKITFCWAYKGGRRPTVPFGPPAADLGLVHTAAAVEAAVRYGVTSPRFVRALAKVELEAQRIVGWNDDAGIDKVVIHHRCCGYGRLK